MLASVAGRSHVCNVGFSPTRTNLGKSKKDIRYNKSVDKLFHNHIRPYDPINLYAEEEREPGTFNTSTVNIQNLVPGCKP